MISSKVRKSRFTSLARAAAAKKKSLNPWSTAKILE